MYMLECLNELHDPCTWICLNVSIKCMTRVWPSIVKMQLNNDNDNDNAWSDIHFLNRKDAASARSDSAAIADTIFRKIVI